MNKLLAASLAVIILSFSAPAFALTITDMNNGNGLAQAILGTGVTISNVKYTGAINASGYFTGGIDAGIGIESGIVLTTGNASELNSASNTADDISNGNVLPGDSKLNGLIPDTESTFDASILEFDFVSQGDAAYFNYVFGSDEYNEYVNVGYNDVFGFFVNGRNVAMVPGTSTAVSVDNVNSGSYSDYYNDNGFDDKGLYGSYPFEYDGFTDVLTATIQNLNAGEAYHIKLAIADVGDSALDSGVFIQAGTFSNTPTPPVSSVPEPSTIILLGFSIIGIGICGRKKIKSSQLPAAE